MITDMASRNNSSMSMGEQTVISESLDRLCNQSATNILVPRFDAYTDVHDFIAEFSRATSTLSDGQRILVIPKAFPVNCHRAWYETELAPMIRSNRSWAEIKKQIITRFSVTDSQDKHFARLRELKYDQDSDKSLLCYVEDVCYSYERAYPGESGLNELKYVRAAIPPSLRAKLNLYSDFKNANDINMLKAAVKDYDAARSLRPKRPQSQEATLELTNLMKQLMENVKKENQAIRTENQALRHEMVAAFHAPEQRAYRSDTNYRSSQPSSYADRNRQSSPHKDAFSSRGYSPGRGNGYNRFKGRSPERNSDHHLNHNQYYPNRGRSPSPANYSRDPAHKINYGDATTYSTNLQEALSEQAFDSKAYYDKFGKPKSPCATCSGMHWSRHCPVHLN